MFHFLVLRTAVLTDHYSLGLAGIVIARKVERDKFLRRATMETFQEESNTSHSGFGTACFVSAVATALGAGALLMYLFDPERGKGRRNRLKDQTASKVNQLTCATGSKARDLRNRAQGVVHDLGWKGTKRQEEQASGLVS
jgi:hypothetical protein